MITILCVNYNYVQESPINRRTYNPGKTKVGKTFGNGQNQRPLPLSYRLDKQAAHYLYPLLISCHLKKF